MDDREEALRTLLIRYQEGDQAAFESFHALVRPMLERFLQGLTRDATRAEDLVQDTFLQIHRARHTYDPAYPPRPWLYAIARHIFLTDLRRRTRRHHEMHAPLPDGLPGGDAPHDEALAAREALDSALAEMSSDTREAVFLHRVRGLSFGEMASRLGVSNVVLRARASRGMARLRRALLREKP